MNSEIPDGQFKSKNTQRPKRTRDVPLRFRKDTGSSKESYGDNPQGNPKKGPHGNPNESDEDNLNDGSDKPKGKGASEISKMVTNKTTNQIPAPPVNAEPDTVNPDVGSINPGPDNSKDQTSPTSSFSLDDSAKRKTDLIKLPKKKKSRIIQPSSSDSDTSENNRY